MAANKAKSLSKTAESTGDAPASEAVTDDSKKVAELEAEITELYAELEKRSTEEADINAMAADMAKLKLENDQLKNAETPLEASQREKDLELNRDALATELAKANTLIEDLKRDRSDNIRPSGIEEIDTLRAELERAQKKARDYDGLKAELDLAYKRVRAYENTAAPHSKKDPINLPAAFTAGVQLISGSFYRIELDGIDPEIPCKALLLGDNMPNHPNTVILYVGDEAPVFLPRHSLTRLSAWETEENGERFLHDRVTIVPQSGGYN